MKPFFLLLTFFTSSLLGGTLEVEVYPPYPMKGEVLSLVVKSNEPLQMVDSFPEIKNWRSGNGIRRGSQTINGNSSYYFIGQYQPEKEGEFTHARSFNCFG